MRNTLFALALVAVLPLAGPAHAFQCPVDIAAIDKVLAKTGPMLPADIKGKVVELRNLGEKLHQGGDHSGAVDALAKALKLLGQ